MLKQVAEVFSVGLSRVRDLETIEKRVEELKHFEERYSLAVTAGKTGVWDLDPERNTIFVDGILWSLIGQDRESCTVSMDEWTSHVYADDYPKLVDMTTDYFAGSAESYDLEFRMVHEDGTLRWFLGRGEAVRDNEGRVIRLAGTNTDISDFKQMEKALQRARRDLEERVKERTSELETASPYGKAKNVWTRNIGATPYRRIPGSDRSRVSFLSLTTSLRSSRPKGRSKITSGRQR
jgi:PAS domain S-box-containing protein